MLDAATPALAIAAHALDGASAALLMRRAGLYDIEYEEGQVEENVPPSRIRIAPGGLDPINSLSHFLVNTCAARATCALLLARASLARCARLPHGVCRRRCSRVQPPAAASVRSFTARGRLRAIGIEFDEIAENHAVPTRFQKGDKVVMFGRTGVFTVTGFAGSSDATVTLIGLARDAVVPEEDSGRPAIASTVSIDDDEARKQMKRKKKISSLTNDDFKPMQLYYPQASWRLSEIENHAVGASVFCRRGGEHNEDGKQERAVVVSKDEVFEQKKVKRESSLADPFGSFLSATTPVFDPVHSSCARHPRPSAGTGRPPRRPRAGRRARELSRATLLLPPSRAAQTLCGTCRTARRSGSSRRTCSACPQTARRCSRASRATRSARR